MRTGPDMSWCARGADGRVVDEGGKDRVAAEDVDHFDRGELALGAGLLDGFAHQVFGEGDAAVENVVDAFFERADLLGG